MILLPIYSFIKIKNKRHNIDSCNYDVRVLAYLMKKL